MNRSNQNTKRILVVDDNQEIHNDFTKILRETRANDQFSEMEAFFNDSTLNDHLDANVEIDSAFQGQQAVEMVRRANAEGRPYSLAFVDVRMPPGMDGVVATQEIWKVDPNVQIVICSAYSDYSWSEIVDKLKFADRFLILKKPFENSEVRQLVSALHHKWLGLRCDSLTNLINRNPFLDVVRSEIQSATTRNNPLSCVMLELDFFKRINDQLGHDAGDEVLRRVAKVLTNNCRHEDKACRYSGSQFCVLLGNTNEAAANEWAYNVRSQLNEIRLSQETPLNLTASFGVVELPSGTQEPEKLVSMANNAMRGAKQLGHDRIVSHSKLTELPETFKRPVFNKRIADVNSLNFVKPTHPILRDATLSDAAAILLAHDMASAPVVDETGALVGVLNEGDLLQVLSEQTNDASLENFRVRDAMQASAIGYPEDTSLQEIFDFIVRVSIPQVVIVRDGKPRGVISRNTLLRWFYSLGIECEPAPGEVSNQIASR